MIFYDIFHTKFDQKQQCFKTWLQNLTFFYSFKYIREQRIFTYFKDESEKSFTTKV